MSPDWALPQGAWSHSIHGTFFSLCRPLTPVLLVCCLGRMGDASIVLLPNFIDVAERNEMSPGYLESKSEPTTASLLFVLIFLSCGSRHLCWLLPPLVGFPGLPWSEARTLMLSCSAPKRPFTPVCPGLPWHPEMCLLPLRPSFSELVPAFGYLLPKLTSEPRESVETSLGDSMPVTRAHANRAYRLECNVLIKNENVVCQGE